MGDRLVPVALPGSVTVESIREHVDRGADRFPTPSDDARTLLRGNRTDDVRAVVTGSAGSADLVTRGGDGPFHRGVLLDNVADYTFVLVTAGRSATSRGEIGQRAAATGGARRGRAHRTPR